jgi:hypothetical protein
LNTASAKLLGRIEFARELAQRMTTIIPVPGLPGLEYVFYVALRDTLQASAVTPDMHPEVLRIHRSMMEMLTAADEARQAHVRGDAAEKKRSLATMDEELRVIQVAMDRLNAEHS